MAISQISADMEARDNVAAIRAARLSRLISVAIPVGTAIFLLLIWQAGVRLFGVPSYIAPAPSDVALVFVKDFATLMANFWPTLLEAVLGFLFGNLVAVLIAIAFVHSRMVERAFFPLAVFINTVPILAIAPILVLIFGSGLTAKVMIAALICFFPTLVNMVRGLNSASPQILELTRVLSASKSEVFWKVRLPSSLPFLFSALKIAATTCVIGAIVGEWVGANMGLGALILDATFNFRSALLYATVFLSSGLSVLLFACVTLAERLIVRW
ncbi:MAG: ABC transporter permease [Martelella sp.]|uniref:Putative aliphatic sulfonates transport permease protein SsuC n=2 Tax=Martelella mediterranea TaxID=293089 RepID=A0A1U9Z7G0_9HYPH|nr:ABC transporter permease [Martelella mediterranea]AQZ53492.1 Putative aliphatic sulfonates transport permease protein SsuC [Martelella mediterranea DSM 17316]